MEDNKKLFECPSCGALVNADAEECPGCNVIFEQQEEDASPLPDDSKETQKDRTKNRWNMFPPPPEADFGKNGPTQEEEEGHSEPDEEPPTRISLGTGITDKKKESPLSLREFTGKPLKMDNEDEDSRHYDEEQQGINGEEQEDGLSPLQESEEEKENLASQESEHELEDSPFNEKEKTAYDDLPEGLQALSRLEEEILSENEKHPIQSPKEQLISALKDYSTRRRKQHLLGTVFLGLGIVLFALLWLVVVYDVLVTQTTSGFGAPVALILVGAGCLFTLGLYMILTYPKSSIIDILGAASRSSTQ